MYALMCNDCDGYPDHVVGKWRSKPNAEQIRKSIGGRWKEDEEKRIIDELVATDICDVGDCASTQYELQTI